MTADMLSPFVPNLRFAEFIDEPSWEFIFLKKLAKRITRRNTRGAKLRVLTNSAKHGVLNQREYFDKDIATNTNNYFVVEAGDYVYNPRISAAAPVGPISKNRLGIGVVSPLYTVFRFWNNDNDFFAHYFKSSNWHGYLRRVANSGARYGRMVITNDDLMRMPILIPPTVAEQKKIADCLGSLDDLIAAEGRKLEALRQHKQGLMQQLFPKPGETMPQLRFLEFRDDPTWSAPQLTDLYDFKRTNTLSRDKLNYETGTIRNIHYGDIHTKFKPIFRVNDEYVPYINPSTSANEIDDGVLCEEGDIVFADASEDLNDVGKAIEVVSLDEERVVAGTHTILGTRKGNVPVVGFGGQLFQSAAVRAGIKKEAQGAKVYGISAKRISAVPVPIPPTMAEQQKIADCLGSLDDLIAPESRKLEALRQHKQGLMQQLFPQLGLRVCHSLGLNYD